MVFALDQRQRGDDQLLAGGKQQEGLRIDAFRPAPGQFGKQCQLCGLEQENEDALLYLSLPQMNDNNMDLMALSAYVDQFIIVGINDHLEATKIFYAERESRLRSSEHASA